MFDFRLTIVLAVLGGLTVSVPISAESDEKALETQMRPPESNAKSQSDTSDSHAVMVSTDAAPKSDAQVESDAAAEPDAVAESDAKAAESDVAPAETGARAETGDGTESDTITQSDAANKSAPATESKAVTESAPAIEAAPAEESKAADSGRRNSVNLSFVLSSIYNFRGRNVFKETSQNDQNALFSPAVTGNVFHPGLWLKYAGFFQINGDNRGYLVDSGVGAEQNIAVGFDYEFSHKLKLSTSLTYLFYPFALSRITGVEWPSYLEPAIGIHYKTNRDIRLGLQISYFAPIQEPLRDQRYMYTLLDIGKAFQFHPKLALDFDLSFGYKLFADPAILQDTIFDLNFSISLPYTIVDKLKLVPGVHAAWAYFVSTRFGDQYMIYFGLDLVADF